MLESTKNKGTSVFIYLIFGLLIAIFVINMGGPGGGGDSPSGGCGGKSNTAITVDGQQANHTSFLVAYNSADERMKKQQREHIALENLIAREILGKAAEGRGIRASNPLIEEHIKKGFFYSGGNRIALPVWNEHEDGTRTWDIKRYKAFVGSLGNLSLTSYQDEQLRELQAALYSSILQGMVRVSEDEALHEYLYDNNTVTYDLVAFDPARYRAAMKLTEADIKRFAETHDAEVQARFKADERLYADVKPQIKLRQIFIAKLVPDAPAPGAGSGSAAGSGSGSAAGSGSATPPVVAAGSGSGSAAAPPVKKVGMPIEEARTKLEAIRTAAATNKQKFIDAAKELNSKDDAKWKAGDLGWQTHADPLLDEKAVNDAVKAMKDGEMTPVITTDKGAYLLLAEGVREKKLAYEQVKLEIAEDLAKDVWSKEQAKRDAITALENARAGTGKNLDQVFEKEPPPPMDFNNLTPEQRKMIDEMMKQQGGGGHGSWIRTPDGALVWESGDQLAGGAGDDGILLAQAGSGSSGGTTGTTGTTTTQTGSAAPTAGSNTTAGQPGLPAVTGGAGSGTAAGSGAAAGSGSGSGSGAPVEKPAPLAPDTTSIVASTDDLPDFGEVEKPKVKHVAGAPRTPQMQGAPNAKELGKVLFDELSDGMLGRRVYESDGTFVLVQLVSKQTGNAADFAKVADTEVERLRQSRARALVDGWLKTRCEQLVKDERIIPNEQFTRPGVDENGKEVPSGYTPCMYFR